MVTVVTVVQRGQVQGLGDYPHGASLLNDPWHVFAALAATQPLPERRLHPPSSQIAVEVALEGHAHLVQNPAAWALAGVEVVVGNGRSLHVETGGVRVDSVAEGWKAQAASPLGHGYCRPRATAQTQVELRVSEHLHSGPGWHHGGESVSEGHALTAGECLT